MTILTDRLREHAQLHDDLRSGDPDQEQWADDLRTVAEMIDEKRWKPIQTAPRDGTPVDLWHKSGFRVTETWWDATDECWSCVMDDGDFTHWMPLPSPPNA